MARPSHVRTAVAELLGERHAWTVDEAHAGLRERGVPADRASVHRALNRLCDDGEARRFELGTRTHFERLGSHHEHVVCEDCGKIAAVPGCVVDEAAVAARTGFAVTGHSVTFSGHCEDCA
ncbi:MAG: Fur family transcriptional regulator, ferric uptake regulator [Solirubrobacteraceae bacterium]|jgi:Fe2+ or Zn2+ uptake regulation protein|nr:Fur family transcriptional regulator, ferric uptake regulator [Solirubrobacteraceae bacterium]